MLRALRNQTKSIFFKCFLFLLICGFALWGVGDLTGGYKGKDILSVESKSVTVEEVLNEIYLLGVVSIGRQENPRRLEMLLNSSLPPKDRVRFFE